MNLKREAVWLAMCAVPAVAFCWMANDYVALAGELAAVGLL